MKKKGKEYGLGTVLILTFLTVLLTGCSAYEFKETGSSDVLLEYTYIDCGEQEFTHLGSYTITVYYDQTYEVKIEGADAEEALDTTTATFSMSEEELTELEDCILEINFFTLPVDISSEGSDGYGEDITVYTKSDKYTVGGYLPSNRDFEKLSNLINEITAQNRGEFIGTQQIKMNDYYK